MSSCDHYVGSWCIICSSPTNVCCGSGQRCDCGTEVCSSCWSKLPNFCHESNYCPTCSGDLITDAVLLAHLLKVYKLDKSSVKLQLEKKHIVNCCSECEGVGTLLLCDGCDRGYHAECCEEGPEPWFCDVCKVVKNKV